MGVKLGDETSIGYLVLGAAGNFPVPKVLQHFADEVDVLAIDGAPSWDQQPHPALDNLPFRSVSKMRALLGGGDESTYYRTSYNYASSTLPIDREFSKWSYCRPSLRILWRDGGKPVGAYVAKSVRLSEINAIPFDVIYSDIQGNEVPVLADCLEKISKNLVYADVETQLEPMYQDQQLFPSLHDLLRSAGMVLRAVGFSDWTPFKSSLSLGGPGFPITGHASYARHPMRFDGMADPTIGRLKAALLALEDADLDYAASALAGAVQSDRGRQILSDPPTRWLAFLAGLARAIRHEGVHPVPSG